jgi:hypothetical protein
MLRVFFLLAAVPLLCAAGTAADLAHSIRDADLDADQCYRVRDLNFNKEDLKFYLTDGFLIFSKPVAGRRLAAVFWGEVEGGDAEIILLPPHRSERHSLGAFTGSPNLDEHFRTAVFLLSGDAGEELLARARQSGKPSQEMGLLVASQFSPVVRNLSESFQLQLVEDSLTASRESALFFAAIAGTRLGNFDVICDPKARDQILAGQLTSNNGATVFNVWASFESRSVRNGSAVRVQAPFELGNYRIEASLDDQLHLSAVTRVTLTPARTTRVFPFQIADQVSISEARLDGKPVEVFTSESLRASAIRGGGSKPFMLVTTEPLAAGKAYEIEFHHQGDVVVDAGNGVYAVTARGTWYPNRGAEFSVYDLIFRYPKRLTLVSTGELVNERVEGEQRVTHRHTSSPVRFAGFNLGSFDRVSLSRAGYTIDIYGNRRVEPVLERRQAVSLPPAFTQPPRRRPNVPPLTDVLAPVTPGSRLPLLADEIAGAFDFMSHQFGPPPLKTLTVSPIPGTFGQGFPGLVYLSTLSYISPDQRPSGVRDKSRQTFFSDLLAPHEVAHQWWGNLVTADSYQDGWLMEALANYSALLYLEKHKGARAIDAVLDEYRSDLLAKGENGKTVESAGPIILGPRLASAKAPGAWRTIQYEKGAWIIHMLRLRMGDQRFLKMLNELCRRYAYKPLSTDAFRKVAEEFMPPGPSKSSLEGFFETWVYGTGVPSIKVAFSAKGKPPNVRVTGTVTQSDVDEDFSADVPVEIQFTGSAPIFKWVRTSSDPVSFSIAAKRPPTRVGPMAGSVLMRR